MARYSAAIAWMGRRAPGSSPRPRATRRLLRAGTGALGWMLTLRPRRALYKLLDGTVVLAESAGYLASNRAPDEHVAADVTVLVDSFPELSETFVAGEARALAGQGLRVRVEASGRAWRPQRGAACGLNATYMEDDGVARKIADLTWLVARHPLGCVRDLAARPRLRREEPVRSLRALAPAVRRAARSRSRHLHAHFAAGAALDAMRIGAFLRIPYSVAPHAYDIWQRPANLAEKLTRSAFATTESEYGAAELRRVAPAARVHRLAMGIDADRFKRDTPHRGGRTVLAVGRLVEKKGFRHLIEAARTVDVDWVVIVGSGPLEAELRELAEGAPVEFAGPRDAGEVRDAMEEADLLAVPSVVAADGDRDSLPVVAREALAMELPVVASELAGLPEVVRPDWGRLVPPGDPAALAAAIDEILALPVERRAAMGRAGRRHVIDTADPDREAAKLARLIAGQDLEDERAAPHGAASDGSELDDVVERVPGRG